MFVAPSGAGDILVEQATEEALREAIELSRSEFGADRILLPPGTLRLSETLVLDRRDEGLQIESQDPAQACRISGAFGLPAAAWSRLDGDERPLWMASLPEGWPEVRTLYFEGNLLPRARSEGFVVRSEAPEDMPFRFRRAIDGRFAYLPPEQLSGIRTDAGAELRLVPKFPWTQYLVPFRIQDREHGLVRSEVPGIYPMTPPAFGKFPEGSAWIENVYSVLDEAGEWIFDPEGRRLILWTPDGRAPGDRVMVPRLTELIRIEGEVDPSDLEDHPVREISLRHLVFSHGNAYAWEADKMGWGLQHDWEMYDRPTAMLRLRGTEECRIEHCRFVNSGAAGVRVDLHGIGNEIRYCDFQHLGGVGVLLAGYGMGYKDVNRENIISDNRFGHLGEHWWHSPAIFVWQSGHNRIVHNRISDLPYSAIIVSTRTQLSVSGDKESSRTARWDEVLFHLEKRGRSWEAREPLMHARNNEVGWNDISRVMEVMGDGNAIYVSGTGAGNRVHHNFIHDITGPNMNAAIRCDDDQHEVTIENNIIARVSGEGLIWKGRCDVINNLLFALRSRTPDGGRTQHARGFLVLSGAPITGSVVRHNIFVGTEPRYPILFEQPEPWKKHGRMQAPVVLSQAKSDHNLFWNPSHPLWAEEFLQDQRARGIEGNSVFADPKFESPKENDFTFPSSSPAAALGIRPLDLSGAGPRSESAD